MRRRKRGTVTQTHRAVDRVLSQKRGQTVRALLTVSMQMYRALKDTNPNKTLMANCSEHRNLSFRSLGGIIPVLRKSSDYREHPQP